jgi:hypothetical protein
MPEEMEKTIREMSRDDKVIALQKTFRRGPLPAP